ncbi:MAG: NifB/NifX family molybdenum-iron cluster-binding protein [Candidatus Hydrogenedentota bacterium]
MSDLIYAIGTNDGVAVSPTHFGDSDKFQVYKISEGGEARLEREIANPSKEIDEGNVHGSRKKRQSVVALLGPDVDFLVAKRMSPNFEHINRQTRICPIVSGIENITELQGYFVENFSAFWEIKHAKLAGKSVELVQID